MIIIDSIKIIYMMKELSPTSGGRFTTSKMTNQNMVSKKTISA